MSAIKSLNKEPKITKNMKSTIMIGAVIAVGAALLLTYLMWYVTPDEYSERVKVIAVTEEGCIAETFDGFAVNIGDCQAQPGEYVNALIDKKIKDRAAAMNPTS